MPRQDHARHAGKHGTFGHHPKNDRGQCSFWWSRKNISIIDFRKLFFSVLVLLTKQIYLLEAIFVGKFWNAQWENGWIRIILRPRLSNIIFLHIVLCSSSWFSLFWPMKFVRKSKTEINHWEKSLILNKIYRYERKILFDLSGWFLLPISETDFALNQCICQNIICL